MRLGLTYGACSTFWRFSSNMVVDRTVLRSVVVRLSADFVLAGAFFCAALAFDAVYDLVFRPPFFELSSKSMTVVCRVFL